MTLSRLLPPNDATNNAIIDAVEDVAKSRGLPMAVVSTAWNLKKGVNPIVGLNSKERIDEIVQAVKVELSEEELIRLEASYVPRKVVGY